MSRWKQCWCVVRDRNTDWVQNGLAALPLQVARILTLVSSAECLTTRGTTIRRHNPCSGLCLETFLRIPLLNGGL